MRAYWDRCAEGRNFGDVLTAAIFRASGVELDWAPPDEADLFGAGSIVSDIPDGYAGMVLGCGLMFEDGVAELGSARVLALRGRLTAERAGVEPPLLADLGLLAGDLLDERPEQDVAIGTVRHFVDPRAPFGLSIDPLGAVQAVIAAAARCRRIVTSSLHGLVLADALGVPSLWDPHPGVLGNGFKFRDYASAYGEGLEPHTWRLADQRLVADKIAALRDALRVAISTEVPVR